MDIIIIPNMRRHTRYITYNEIDTAIRGLKQNTKVQIERYKKGQYNEE